MIDPRALQPTIMNLRMLENNLGGAKLELQNMVDPITAIAAVKAGTEAADKVMDVVERGAKLVGDAVKWADQVTDEAADVERIKGVLDFIKQEQHVLVQYAGKLLTQSISALSLNAHDITKALEDVHFLARAVKSKSIDTKDYIEMQDELAGGAKLSKMTQDQLDLWQLTLESLLDTLETSHKKTHEIRIKLEQISRDIVKLKATIEGMVATAQTNVNARIAQLQKEHEDAKANADRHRGCFKDVGEGIKTILTLGISCAMLDQALKKAEKAARDIDRTKMNFQNNVAPLVDKLKGLNGVAEDLLNEAMTKTTVVREFEEELKSKITAFKQKQGTTLAIRMQKMRSKMVVDLNELIASCDKTIVASAAREGDFKSILVEADKKMKETKLQLVNLAANEGQLFLI